MSEAAQTTMGHRIEGFGHTYQRGRRWWARYWHRGRDYREAARSLKEADAWKLLRKRHGETQGKRFVGPSEERATFGDLKRDYLRDYEIRGLRSKDTAEDRVKHLEAFFGGDKALHITTDRIRAYQADRLQDKASGATINRETAALARMFHLAVKAGCLSTRPVFPERVEENPPRQGFFEHPEYLAIREPLPSDYQDVLDFGYLTGWRRHEITELTWADVDLPGSVIRLAPRSSTKRKSGRLLPVSPPLRDVLARRLQARRLDTPLVFHRNGRPIGDWRKRWYAACKAAGFWREWTDAAGQTHGEPTRTLHDCRRTAARNYIRAGVPERVAMDLLGHKTRSIFDRYNIVSEGDLKQATARLASYVASQPTTSVVVPLRKAQEAGS